MQSTLFVVVTCIYKLTFEYTSVQEDIKYRSVQEDIYSHVFGSKPKVEFKEDFHKH